MAPLKDEAMATSSVHPSHDSSPYVDIRRRRPLLDSQTVVARANECVIADAFTKIALLLPFPAAQQLANEYDAQLSFVS